MTHPGWEFFSLTNQGVFFSKTFIKEYNMPNFMEHDFEYNDELLGDIERSQLIENLSKDCVALLGLRGGVEKPARSFSNMFRFLGEKLGVHPPSMKTRTVRTLTQDVTIKDQRWPIKITSSSEDPQLSEFIEIRIGEAVRVLYLGWDDALLLDDWKMGDENIYDPEIFDPEEYYGGEEAHDNPRPAFFDEMLQFRKVIDSVKEEVGYPF